MNYKNIFRLAIATGCLFAAVDPAHAQGTPFTYQGRLNSGGSVANGVYDLRFTLYNALTNGSTTGPVLTNSATSISNGLFLANLDFGAGVFNGTPYWLEIAVRSNGVATSFTTLTPRQPLTAAPYALYATNAGAAATADTATTAANSTTAGSATNFSGSLAGDVTGNQATTVVGSVGGVSAANVAAGANAANAATSTNTPNTLVRRDASGNFAAGTIIATNFAGNGAGLTNLTSPITVGSATNFTGSLAGDVTGKQATTVVGSVGGVSAANVAAGANAANAASSTNTPSTLVQRNASGSFSAGTVIATNFTGNGAGLTNLTSPITVGSATNFTGSLAGDVTGKQATTVVGSVGGVSAANVAAGANAANTATSTNTPNTIIQRSASGNFSAGTITATFVGNGAGLTNLSTSSGGGTTTNFSGSLAGDVTGTQSNTVVGKVGGVTAANVATVVAAANAATSANTANAIVKRDGSGNFSAGAITAVSFTGNGAGLTNLSVSGGTSATPPPGMVLIPAGTFTMGDSVDNESDATPTVSVTLSAFDMDANLVSFSQWQGIYYWATANSYSLVDSGAGKAPNNPVQTVDWFDAVKWCNARSEQAGLTPVYYTDAGFTSVYRTGEVTPYANWAANGYRLPTEAEWERAARGGINGQRFPWGNLMSENLANYHAPSSSYSYDLGPPGYNSIGSVGGTTPATSPVGSFAANVFGLFDMSGNVLEWCWDWYATPYAGGTNPRGPASGTNRVARGGYWNGDARTARCADRSLNNPPFVASTSVGFRCVKTP